MSTQIREDEIYKAIIVGVGLAGLTTAYMLRDKNIHVLEKENRFVGRVYSEQMDDLTNNIGILESRKPVSLEAPATDFIFTYQVNRQVLTYSLELHVQEPF